MRLKTLEMQGFKSFPERIKLDFNTGLTGIVGPNGSGKSNISDAIRWVLGEMSSRNIRGQKMEDVIFGGTDIRRPMGYAEVSLTFDNTVGDMKLPLDFDEVTITRKYYRNGDSEYMINHKNVRLRDINELFMNTGLGRSGYSIIGQGRIAEIISKKSEDRRGIFEEAAGISKYRYKKSDAERKLAETTDNLDRVNDILSELEGRVEPLRIDSEKAKKYLELYEQKKQADVSIWLYEINSIKSRTEELENAFSIAKHELEIADDDLTALESKNERLYMLSQETRIKAETKRRYIGEYQEKKHESDSQEALLHNNIEHFDSESALIRADSKAKAAAIEKANDLGAKTAQGLEEDEKALADLEAKLGDDQGALDEKRAQINAQGEITDKIGEEEESLSAALIEKQLSLSALDATKETAAEHREELREQSDALGEQIKKLGQAIIESQKTLGAYEEKLADIKDTVAQYDEKIKEISASRNISAERVEEISGSLAAVNGRLDALKRLEEHFEGYVNSVKFVLEKASEGALKGICGPVSKLISVSPDLVVAIETALGANIQNIVVENERAAKDAIALLKSSGAGRATFYPLDTISPTPLAVDANKLKSCRGYVGIASSLISYDKKYKDIAEYLLSHTVICRTIDDASDIAKAFAFKFKIVTLDGQVINSGGSYTGGSAKRDSGILTRGNEIKTLENKAKEYEREIEKLKASIADDEKKIASIEGEKTSSSSEFDVLTVMYNTENTQLEVSKSRLDADNARLSELFAQESMLTDQERGYNEHRAQIEEAIAQAQGELDNCRERLKASEEKEKELEASLETLINEKNASLLMISAKRKDIEYREGEIARIGAEINTLNSDIAENSRKLDELERKKNEAAQAVKDNRSASSELQTQIEALIRECEELSSASDDYEKQTADLRVEMKDKQHHRENIFRTYTSLDAKMQGVTGEQEKYTSRLWDEYELTYSQASELEYPTITQENKGKVASEQTRLRSKIRELGAVNVGAIEEYKQVKERYDFLSGQYNDLTASKEDLNQVIARLEREMKVLFADTFERVNENFRVVFAELFGGGTGELSLTDPDNILECGIEINVAPPGKIIKNLSLLSGGEQVFVAIALFFAILKVSPAPFCLLDEIEAALDEVNVARFAQYAKKYSDKTQFIVITHRRGTMEEADRLYGVTMPERGVSRVFTLNIDEAEAKLGEKF